MMSTQDRTELRIAASKREGDPKAVLEHFTSKGDIGLGILRLEVWCLRSEIGR